MYAHAMVLTVAFDLLLAVDPICLGQRTFVSNGKQQRGGLRLECKG